MAALKHQVLVEHAKLSTALKGITKTNQYFSGKIYPALIDGVTPGHNLVTSVYSITSSLSMILAGSEGLTKDQIKTVFNLRTDDDVRNLYKGFKELSNFIKSNDFFKLESANKIFVQEGYKLLKSFLEVTSQNLGSMATNVDFCKSQETSSDINRWVGEMTEGKIKDLISPDSLDEDTRIVLVNAVYFKGVWKTRFDERNTFEEDFHVTSDQTLKVMMMHGGGVYKEFRSEYLGCRILELPYSGNRLSMHFFLSDDPEGFAAMEDKFNSFDFSKNLHEEDHTEAYKVTVPKFKLETELDLVKSLKKVGTSSMFDKKLANFTGMSSDRGQGNLHVSSAVQKAFVEVNEEGTEAAAATAVTSMCCSGSLYVACTREFRCDRPFLFAIRDRLTGLVLFSGRVVNPINN